MYGLAMIQTISSSTTIKNIDKILLDQSVHYISKKVRSDWVYCQSSNEGPQSFDLIHQLTHLTWFDINETHIIDA